MMGEDPDTVMSLPAARAWSDSFGGGLDALDYVGQHVSPTEALAVSEMLWPAFVEHRGCVILRGQFDEALFDDWWSALDGDASRIESVMNHIHLWDVFTDREEPGSDLALERLARAVATSWKAALAVAYPDGRFAVQVDDDGDGPTVTFHTLGVTAE
jgi:hypothetical protein